MAIISRVKRTLSPIFTSILTRMLLVILAVTALLLVAEINVPVRITRSMIFDYKNSLLMGDAQTVASSLDAYQKLTGQAVEEVMEILGLGGFDEVLVTDETGLVLYSASASAEEVGSTALFPEIVSALRGNDTFGSVYDGSAFISRGAVPVVSGGEIIGCVYIGEKDTDQAAMVTEIGSYMMRAAAVTVAASILIYIVFTFMIIRKNRNVLRSIRRVGAGDYDYRIEIRGRDEFAVIANEFNHLTDRLQETEQRRRQFVSDASHELRTPLAAIRLLSDSILQNDMDMETVRDFVGDIAGESDRLTRMTSKLLSLTALDSRQFTPEEPEKVNLGECCRKAVRLLSPSALEKGAQIEESSEDDCYVLAREDDIFQLVLNLAENGVKYSAEKGLVRLIAYSSGGKAVLIVEDNGIGIPEEELERIFQRFYRVDKARSREAGGTGLGLAIAKETVEKFGGTITASNRRQGGARFTVEFPAWNGGEEG